MVLSFPVRHRLDPSGVQSPKPRSGRIPTRTLGRTGQKLTIVGMGGARFHPIPFAERTALERRAYDLGINYFDMACRRGLRRRYPPSARTSSAYDARNPPTGALPKPVQQLRHGDISTGIRSRGVVDFPTTQ